MIKVVDLDLRPVRNNSTTVKTFGKIPDMTKTGLKLVQGKSKDHRPDLKQLVLSLSVSSDGAVPVHYKTYPGNRTHDTTHIETWNTVRIIANRNDFIYVADCKVCTSKQLGYIVGGGGRVITIMPETWKESKTFKEQLRFEKKEKKCIWDRNVPGQIAEFEYFSIFRSLQHREGRVSNLLVPFK
jgi:transposase